MKLISNDISSLICKLDKNNNRALKTKEYYSCDSLVSPKFNIEYYVGNSESKDSFTLRFYAVNCLIGFGEIRKITNKISRNIIDEIDNKQNRSYYRGK